MAGDVQQTKCTMCGGTGEITTAGGGQTVCPRCKGTGINPTTKETMVDRGRIA